jgi:hypothetical protein
MGRERAALRFVPAALALLALLAPIHARALDASRSEALAQVKSHLEARGARDVREVLRDFLFEGESRVHELAAARGGCVGLLALGLGEVRDVDLSLHTVAGQALAEDTAVAPYAYVRACVAANVPLLASVQLYAGRGELVLFAMQEAPRELGRFAEGIPLAMPPGGGIEALRTIGGVPDESPFEGPMLAEERELAELGYVAPGPVVPLLLRGGQATSALVLEAGRCYQVVVLVPFARGVAIKVEAPDGTSWDGRMPAADRAAAFLCTERTGGEFQLRVESRVLRSVALVRAFEHPDVDPRDHESLGAARALGVAEARHVARARGLRVERVGEAWVESAVPLSWPVTLQAGRCYAVWALGERGLASVDVRLVDGAGVLVARTEGPPHGASVFHCASKGGGHRLVLRPRGQDGIVSVWLGSTDGSSP